MTTIPLPWTKPPLQSNDRLGWPERARRTRLARLEAGLAVRMAKVPPHDTAVVTLSYRVPDRRRRDSDSVYPTLKVSLDALVDCGVLSDDRWPIVTATTCRIHPPDGSKLGALWLEVDAA